jgi:hypothetical protein
VSDEWRTDDGLWRKRRGGRPYGSWHAYSGGRIVNLGTLSLDEARDKAKKLAAAVVSPTTPSDPLKANTAAADSPAAPRRRRSPLRNWAVAEAGDRPAPPPPPAAPPPPPKPELTPAMVGLADGLAGALAKFNAVAASLVIRVAKKGTPPSLDDDEIKALEKTYATGLKEMMLLQGLQWWHILAVQNGAMLVRMYGDSEPLAPATLRPVPHAAP